MLIDGRLRAAEADATIAVLNPATGQEIGRAPDASQADVDRAVVAACAAFRAWRERPVAERQAAVRVFAETLRSNADELARLFTAEQGRPLPLARSEIMGAAAFMDGISALAPPVEILEDTLERRVEVRHVPLGVVAAIAPWNFPVILALWKVAPALIAGNTVVLKPSPFTPLVMLRIAALVAEQLPPGVFNVVSGGDSVGPWLTAHSGVAKISFTGSAATGKRVMESAARDLKRVTLELGGNDAAIVLADVDLATAVPALFWAAMRNSGQICIAAKRIYVHDSIYDAFRDAFVAFARGVRMGDGSVAGVELGPVQNRPQAERVRAMIADCRDRGETVITAGEASAGDGFFVPVTVVDNPGDGSPIVREEPFGPVVPLLRFTDVDDVVARANDSPFGLAASVWTRDLDLADGLARRLEAGTVWINEVQYLHPWQPFGGHKHSGIGVENGLAGLLSYTNAQTLVTRKPVA